MYKSRKPILDVLQGRASDNIPVWFMRQAGRYLKEYREIRAKSKNFLNMFLDPDVACEITLQPVRRFGVDAAILFADILLVPMALGLKLEFVENKGPVLQKVGSDRAFEGLSYDAARVAPVFETVRKVKKALPEETALIGFCGAPWTLACYMLCGQNADGFAEARLWAKEKPESLQRLIGILIDASESYLAEQIKAGAEVIQIFDSWAGLLKDQDFLRFVVAPTKELVARVKKAYPEIPIIGFPREAGEDYIPFIQQTGVDALSIDQNVPLDFAKRKLQPVKPLQGNLDPRLLVEGGKPMFQMMEKILITLGPRHIANLGHGVLPETPPENVGALVAFIQGFRL